MDGGGKGENKISHELAVTVIYSAGNEAAGARVQQEQMQEPGDGAARAQWLEGAVVLNPDSLPFLALPTATHPRKPASTLSKTTASTGV